MGKTANGAGGVQVYAHTYEGWASAVIESGVLRVELVPELGGKLVSLRYKPTDKEWLLNAGSRTLRRPSYGSSFIEWDMSGWDECFPTIDACRYEGEMLPDHGEVWSLPWSCRLDIDAIACAVETKRQQLRLTRTLSMPAPDRLCFAYRADNLGDRQVSFLWAAHPQFAVDEPTRVLLPEALRELLCVFGGRRLTRGALYEAAAFRNLSSLPTGDGRKLYASSEVAVGRTGLYGGRSRSYITLQASPAEVPHFGLWVDEGMFNDRNAVSLEPGIGFYDSLERAQANETAGVLAPGGCREWHLELAAGDGGCPIFL